MKRMLTVLCVYVSLTMTASLVANAATVSEVAELARQAGYSEEMIQQGINEWSSGNYTQADLDEVYVALGGYISDTDDLIEDILLSGDGDATSTDTSQSDSDDSSANDEASDTSNDTGDVANACSTDEDSDTSISEAQTGEGEDDASHPATISSEEFVAMTLEEKQTYVASLSEEEQTEFVAGLTQEEKNSILKQMSIASKADLLSSYISVAESMGVSVTVDELTDSNISVTMRDADGNVVDTLAVGTSVDMTGLDNRGVFLLVGILLTLAVVAFVWSRRYLAPTGESDE